MRATFLIPFLVMLSCQQPDPIRLELVFSESYSGAVLQAISILDEDIAWVSGHNATFLRTLDGGRSWHKFQHPVDSLQFRDIHAVDQNHVILMSSGLGSSSQILHYEVSDSSWKVAYQMPHKAGFLNSIAFWDADNGLAFGDTIDEGFFILKTSDGGLSWHRIDTATLPSPGEGEGGFAASGSCIATRPGGNAWIGTGANGYSRVLYTQDYGDSWSQQAHPLITGAAAGIFNIHMKQSIGLIAGGDLKRPEAFTDNLALSLDQGKTWTLCAKPQTPGVFYGGDVLERSGHNLLVVCGPNGMDYSIDQGAHWVQLDTANYWAVQLHTSGVGYACGADGRLSKLIMP